MHVDHDVESLERDDVVFWDEGDKVCAGIIMDFLTQPTLVVVKTTDVVDVGRLVRLQPSRLRHHADKKHKEAVP